MSRSACTDCRYGKAALGMEKSMAHLQGSRCDSKKERSVPAYCLERRHRGDHLPCLIPSGSQAVFQYRKKPSLASAHPLPLLRTPRAFCMSLISSMMASLTCTLTLIRPCSPGTVPRKSLSESMLHELSQELSCTDGRRMLHTIVFADHRRPLV